ncbi:pyridoxal-phosphate dependent enzyme [Kitasatospora sp. NPDC001540]|uniref:pyridoxal-phosphate dependent enzyme n=1 Tax=Kitasatospora sp. NPDC001540 TaxID=3364014 RepID=UPI0036A7205E
MTTDVPCKELQYGWEAAYQQQTQDAPLWQEDPIPVIPEAIKALSARKVNTVVDLGCGDGRNLAALVDAGFTALGVDIAPTGLKNARRIIRQRSFLLRADATELPLIDASVWTPCVWTNQYDNPENPAIHRQLTGPEIFQQFPQAPGAVFAAISTGGTFAGLSQFFREASPSTRMVAVDIEGSVAFHGPPGRRHLSGIGAGRPSTFLDDSLVDRLEIVDIHRAVRYCRLDLKSAGLHLGASAGPWWRPAPGTWKRIRRSNAWSASARTAATSTPARSTTTGGCARSGWSHRVRKPPGPGPRRLSSPESPENRRTVMQGIPDISRELQDCATSSEPVPAPGAALEELENLPESVLHRTDEHDLAVLLCLAGICSVRTGHGLSAAALQGVADRYADTSILYTGRVLPRIKEAIGRLYEGAEERSLDKLVEVADHISQGWPGYADSVFPRAFSGLAGELGMDGPGDFLETSFITWRRGLEECASGSPESALRSFGASLGTYREFSYYADAAWLYADLVIAGLMAGDPEAAARTADAQRRYVEGVIAGAGERDEPGAAAVASAGTTRAGGSTGWTWTSPSTARACWSTG